MSQVQPIIRAAEQAATGIIEDAEERARRYVEESRRRADEIAMERAEDLWTLTDGLIERAESVKQQSDELLTALNQTKRGTEAALQAGADPAFAEPAAQSPPIVEQAPPEEAKLLATQIAVAGGSRSEIARRLLDEFGIHDPEPVLNEILGPA
jgi:vacuolar-type H+-ATPase subunit H